jgi:hypothetical protein
MKHLKHSKMMRHLNIFNTTCLILVIHSSFFGFKLLALLIFYVKFDHLSNSFFKNYYIFCYELIYY